MKQLSFFLFLSAFLWSCESKQFISSTSTDTVKLDMNMAFVRDGNVCYYSESADSLHIIDKGSDPALSPNGEQLAYTEIIDSNLRRRVVILDLKSRNKRYIGVKSDHYGPKWNQNGSLIAFRIRLQDQWRIGLVDQNNLYKQLPPLSPSHESTLINFTWSNDATTLLIYSNDTLTAIDTADMVKHKFTLKEIAGGRAPSSYSKIILSPDQSFILYNAINLEGHYAPNRYRANAPDALYKYDLNKKQLIKITPDSLYCSTYTWINQDSICFSGFSILAQEHMNNIYFISSTGTGLKKIVSNAGGETISRGK